jgi:hypothetical protein
MNDNGSTRILVCGGRDFSSVAAVYKVLDIQLRIHRHVTVIEGGAKGADALAANWVKNPGWAGTIKHEQYPADWHKHGKAAGPIRNQQMLDTGIDLVLAFPGGRGTADMIQRAQKAGVEVVTLDRLGEETP